MSNQILQNIKKLGELKSLHHAYIFVSHFPSHLEIELIAIGAFFEGRKNAKESDLIDFKIFRSEFGHILKIETALEVRKYLEFKSIKSYYRIALISASFGLTIEAQNSLLKITEEPHEQAIIFLIINHEDQLLKTLRSRFEIIDLKVNENILNIKVEQDLSLDLASNFLKRDFKGKKEWVFELIKKGEEQNIEKLIDGLIKNLSNDLIKNASKLKDLFRIRAYLGRMPVNPRLHLDYFINTWYNDNLR